ncbi:unnamed protein product, partial [Mesorhabditis belari]|uniref:tRNA-intron lyase n=1 Tax=Mesorhabditis belari TaxID=2138241 RepID=A0AAF3EBR5_9BILA
MSTDEVDKRVNIVHIEGKFFVHDPKELDKLKNLPNCAYGFQPRVEYFAFHSLWLTPGNSARLVRIELGQFRFTRGIAEQIGCFTGLSRRKFTYHFSNALEASNQLSKCDETISTPNSVEFFPDSADFYASSKIFRDLWINGYYVTCGQKFGCHYLAYEASPDSVHSSYMVWRLDNSRNADFLSHLPILQRAATQMCKKILLATTNPDADVPHYSLIERFTGLDRLKRVGLEESSDFKKGQAQILVPLSK